MPAGIFVGFFFDGPFFAGRFFVDFFFVGRFFVGLFFFGRVLRLGLGREVLLLPTSFQHPLRSMPMCKGLTTTVATPLLQLMRILNT